MAFDTTEVRKTCFNHGLIPNIPENPRHRKQTKRGRKQLFNPDIYQDRFGAERTFAWVDKFKRLLLRFERNDTCFLGAHYIAFTMINLRHGLAKESLNEPQAAPTMPGKNEIWYPWVATIVKTNG